MMYAIEVNEDEGVVTMNTDARYSGIGAADIKRLVEEALGLHGPLGWHVVVDGQVPEGLCAEWDGPLFVCVYRGNTGCISVDFYNLAEAGPEALPWCCHAITHGEV